MLIEGASFFDIPEDSGSQFISAGTEELEAIRGSSLSRCLGEPLPKEGGYACHMVPSEVEISSVTDSKRTG